MERLLEINDLHVSFKMYKGEIQAVRGVSFHLEAGETLAIVGESGSGKSVTAQAIMGMIPKPHGRIKKGNINFKDKEITTLSKKQLRQLRGKEIGMVFQDPMTSLNPTMKIGHQIDEVFIKKQKATKKEAKAKTIELLKSVGIADAETRYSQYPHEFSGGMRQRVVIAIALACNPAIIIADEPTTALDVTIQAQILNLLRKIQTEKNSSILLITHDLGVVAEVADRVAVMYAGMVIETGTVTEIFEQPKHPYTWGLLRSVPKPDAIGKERLIPIEGTPPDLFSPPKGCPFAARCPHAMEVCVEHMPEAETFSDSHQARCWLNDPRAQTHLQVAAGGVSLV
ncbi:ABC transporter ATP-binding protein [Lederbergia panacisoli]|uniref:ABC transporter ATP-binding protein n=1 Tax=Lederbergia panacisoli TaxID=1255251 RepID=UPI00214D093E|nr:ABC transporter ATP-binding protein [Lederbergia panacisoli]MCR2821148.1 ABC transporter ATP-binding protein [Lederbergia panacisoli]